MINWTVLRSQNIQDQHGFARSRFSLGLNSCSVTASLDKTRRFLRVIPWVTFSILGAELPTIMSENRETRTILSVRHFSSVKALILFILESVSGLGNGVTY